VKSTSKGRFVKPEKLQTHSNEEKERGEGKEEKREKHWLQF